VLETLSFTRLFMMKIRPKVARELGQGRCTGRRPPKAAAPFRETRGEQIDLQVARTGVARSGAQ